MIIDATNLILGRMASIAAKKALLGEDIKIINCEKAIISGNKKYLLEKYKSKREMGVPLKGPYYPKMPDRIVRRAIRGMLPYKRPRGAVAYKKIMCYIGIPEKFANEKQVTLKEADASKLPTTKYLTIERISKHLGAKI